jgi:UDP-2,3-diacylglucosamine hydrolase
VGNLYFASDFHLGVPNAQESLVRERKLVAWLESIAPNADEIFLVGDVFDFWFEYKYVVPKGYTRLFGCLAKLADSGIKLHFFKGNHDMWMFGYFEQEFGAKVHSNEYIFERDGKKFFIHHGDGLGKGDEKYKLLKKIFRSELCQRTFAFLHPSIGIGLANYFSSKSRLAQMPLEMPSSNSIIKKGIPHDLDLKNKNKITCENEEIDLEKEWLVQYCKEVLQTTHYDYMIFGHRHLALDVPMGAKSRYINLGDWFKFYTYAEFNGTDVALLKYNL